MIYEKIGKVKNTIKNDSVAIIFDSIFMHGDKRGQYFFEVLIQQQVLL
jgi:hypothetical protein